MSLIVRQHRHNCRWNIPRSVHLPRQQFAHDAGGNECQLRRGGEEQCFHLTVSAVHPRLDLFPLHVGSVSDSLDDHACLVGAAKINRRAVHFLHTDAAGDGGVQIGTRCLRHADTRRRIEHRGFRQVDPHRHDDAVREACSAFDDVDMAAGDGVEGSRDHCDEWLALRHDSTLSARPMNHAAVSPQ